MNNPFLSDSLGIEIYHRRLLPYDELARVWRAERWPYVITACDCCGSRLMFVFDPLWPYPELAGPTHCLDCHIEITEEDRGL